MIPPEDYLEEILAIRAERGRCRNVDIAEHMGVAKPSVTKVLANLAQKGFVDVVDRDARLTSEGHRLAEEALAKHLFFEGMLLDVGVDAEVASEEACRMEHRISDPSFRRLACHLADLRGQGKNG